MEFKGFITNLGKYNEGDLVGKWIDFPIDEEELEEVLEEIGINEQYEEYFFSDFENNIFDWGAYTDITHINQVVEEYEYLCQKYSYHNEIEDIIEVLLNERTDNIFELDNEIDNLRFFSGCKTMLDCAYREVEELYSFELEKCPVLKKYFDYEEYADDMEDNGHWFEYSGGMMCLYW